MSSIIAVTPNLVIIEKRRLIADSLKTCFLQANRFTEVHIVDSGHDALRLAKETRTIYLICGQPYPKARQIAQTIQHAQPECTLVVLDYRFRQSAQLLACKTELHGCWTYDDAVSSIAPGLIDAANRHKSLSPYVEEKMQHVENRIVSNSIPVHDLDRLTEREMQLLGYIACGYSQDERAALLKISRKSVQNLQERLMKKLDIHSNIQLLWCAIRFGLVEM